MSLRAWAIVVLTCVSLDALYHVRLVHGAATQACAIESVGVDTSLADNSVSALNGDAPGETFTAVDTLIRSIAVWRVAPEALNPTPMKLWITEVDSTGRPLTGNVVFDGPAPSLPIGDGIHPTKIQYSFDPPIALPHRGQYFFAIQELCWGWFDLLTTTIDAYPGGSAWRTARSSFSGCILSPIVSRLIRPDLVFTIEFCRDTTTAASPGSWGRIKTMYR